MEGREQSAVDYMYGSEPEPRLSQARRSQRLSTMSTAIACQQATERHQAMTTYSATTLQAFIPGLVETLMLQQPADPISFLRAHLDTLVAEHDASSADETAGPSPRTTEMRLLRAEVARLRSENEQLRLEQRASALLPSPPIHASTQNLSVRRSDACEGQRVGAMRGADKATFRACNWNLAGSVSVPLCLRLSVSVSRLSVSVSSCSVSFSRSASASALCLARLQGEPEPF